MTDTEKQVWLDTYRDRHMPNLTFNWDKAIGSLSADTGADMIRELTQGRADWDK